MALKLASIKADLAREEAGDWIKYPPWEDDDVALHVSSLFTPAYQTAKDQLMQRLLKAYKGKPVPPDVMTRESGKIYAKHILHGWRGFVDDNDDEIPYTPERALEMLCDPAYRDLVAAVEWCATRLAERDAEFLETSEKNSERPSAGTCARKAQASGCSASPPKTRMRRSS